MSIIYKHSIPNAYTHTHSTTSGHQITKAISDPGNTPSIENQQKEGEKEEAPKKASRRRSSAALVEEAVRRRNLAKTEKKDLEEEEKDKGTPSRRRKHAVVRNSFETSAVHQPTAQIVANAAAIKAKEMKKQKPLRDEKRKELIKSQGYKEQNEQLVIEEKMKRPEKLPTFHPLQKSRSFEGEKVTGKTQEPTWISLAKVEEEREREGERDRVPSLLPLCSRESIFFKLILLPFNRQSMRKWPLPSASIDQCHCTMNWIEEEEKKRRDQYQ